jgi:hypothetical protein
LRYAKSLAKVREGKISTLLKEVEKKHSFEMSDVMIAAIGGKVSKASFSIMLTTYKKWNAKEPYDPSDYHAKTYALADAILRTMSYRHLPQLRKTMMKIRLTPSSRSLMHGLVKFGNISDIKLLLDRIAEAVNNVRIWNHTEICVAGAKQLAIIAKKVPTFLMNIVNREEFWSYIPSSNRAKRKRTELLPIKDNTNRSLYVRLAAYAVIGSAQKDDQNLLINLTAHEYGLIARTAAVRLVNLLEEDALRNISENIEISLRNDKAASIATALRYAEIQLYGLAKLW